MEAGRQAGRLEGRGDLSHLARIAPRLGRGDRRGLDAPALQVGLGYGPFFQQGFVHALGRRERAHRQNQRVGAFAPGGISHLERGGGPRLLPDGPGGEHARRKQLRHFRGAGPGEIKTGGSGPFYRRPDDAAVDKTRPGFGHDLTDSLGRRP